MKLRLWYKRIHLWLAIITTIPLVFVSITGALLVYMDPIDAFLKRDLFKVAPASDPKSLEEWLGAARKANPDIKIDTIKPPSQPDESVRVYGSKDDVYHQIYVNPYDLSIIGAVDSTEWSLRNLISILVEIHYNLKAGEIGAKIVGFSAIFLSFSIFTGILLWIPKQWTSLKHKLQLKIAKRWKQTAYGLHANLGMYLSLGLFLIALTGVFIAFWEVSRKTLAWMTGSPQPKPEFVLQPDINQTRLPLGEIVRKSQAYIQTTYGIDASPEYFGLGNAENAIMRVSFMGPTRLWGLDSYTVLVNPYTGVIESDATEKVGSTADRIMSLTFPLHYGNWGDYFSPILGQFTRILWIILALMPVFLIVTGFSYWKKPKWLSKKLK